MPLYSTNILIVSRDRVSFIAQTGLELLASSHLPLLPWPLKGWDYRHESLLSIVKIICKIALFNWLS